jgi:phosphoglycolate phosphatase
MTFKCGLNDGNIDDKNDDKALRNVSLLNKQLVLARPIELILFDLDGTLIDSVPDLAIALNRMLAEFALPTVSENLAREWVGNGAGKLVERALAFAVNQLEVSQKRASDVDDISASHPKALDAFLAHYDACCADKTVLYDGVIDALKQFKRQHITMAIVTNKPHRFIAPILEHLSIAPYFTLLLGGDELAHKKPHPEPLLHCINALNFSASQVLMVGDSRNDIQAARAAHITVAAMNYGYNHGQPIELDKPDTVFASMVELAKQLA